MSINIVQYLVDFSLIQPSITDIISPQQLLLIDQSIIRIINNFECLQIYSFSPIRYDFRCNQLKKFSEIDESIAVFIDLTDN